MTEPTFQLPLQTPDPVLPFQVDGVRFLTAHRGRGALLADDPGLGKTIQTILAARMLNVQSALVLCPPVARINWKREIERWWPDMKGDVGTPMDSSELGRYLIDIVGYSHISEWTRLRTDLLTHQYDLLVLDEAHRLKGTSKRARVVWGKHYNGKGPCLVNNANTVWALSGTPMPNHAGELFNIMRGLWPNALHQQDPRLVSREVFEETFCRKRMIQNRESVYGSKNLALLRSLLKPNVLRRKKTEVRPEFPALRFDTEALGGHVPEDTRQRVYEAAREALGHELGDDQAIMERIGQDLLHYRDKLSAVRRLTGILKVPACVDHIAQWLLDNPNEKAIVFAYHREVIEKLAKDMQAFEPVMIYGKMPEASSQWAIDQFQSNPNKRVFVGQIEACGEAITLTAASRVFFVESDWTPSKNFQAASRADRIGQVAAVLATFLYLPNSIDELLQIVQLRKTKEAHAVFG